MCRTALSVHYMKDLYEVLYAFVCMKMLTMCLFNCSSVSSNLSPLPNVSYNSVPADNDPLLDQT